MIRELNLTNRKSLLGRFDAYLFTFWKTKDWLASYSINRPATSGV